jgi:hypothetical protein
MVKHMRQSYRLLAVALANFAFAAVCSFKLLTSFREIILGGILIEPLRTIYLLMSTVNLIAALALAIGGTWLLCSSYGAIRFCTVLFVSELIYSLVIGTLWLTLSGTIGEAIVSVTSVGNPVIVPQLKVAYPVFALLLLRLNMKRSDPHVLS